MSQVGGIARDLRGAARRLGWDRVFQAKDSVMRRWFVVALALAIWPVGDADAHGHRGRAGPVTTICHWGGTLYNLGGYCTAPCAAGACPLEVCLGDECRRAC